MLCELDLPIRPHGSCCWSSPWCCSTWPAARGILLLALAFVISALASYVLLSRQREVLAGALNRRLGRVTAKATEFRERLEEGTGAEDAEAPAGEPAVAETSGEAAPRG